SGGVLGADPGPPASVHHLGAVLCQSGPPGGQLWGWCQTLFLVLTCCLGNQKQSLTLRQVARERRIISKCETFHRNPAGNQPRPAEPGQQPEASLAWGRATVTAKRRQRDQTLCD